MALRHISFKAAVSSGRPAIMPIDAETGEMLHGVRKCEVLSEMENVTVMRLELILLQEGEQANDCEESADDKPAAKEVTLEELLKVATVALNPNDVVVVTPDGLLKPEQIASIGKTMKYAFPHNKCILMDAGAKIEIVRPSEAPKGAEA